MNTNNRNLRDDTILETIWDTAQAVAYVALVGGIASAVLAAIIHVIS